MKSKVLVLLLVAFSSAALAQKSNGYVFFAPGAATESSYSQATLHAGVGGEGILGKGIGVGAEIGALWPKGCFTDCVLGMLSPNAYYHFTRRGKLDPFVTGGYTLAFRGAALNMFNFGGGVNYWLSDGLGVRVEFRDHVHTATYGSTHFWGVRVGLAFR